MGRGEGGREERRERGGGGGGGEHGELIFSETQLFDNDSNFFMW